MTDDTLQQLAEKVQECFTNAPASVDLNGTTVTYREEIVKCALEVAYALGRKQGAIIYLTNHRQESKIAKSGVRCD